AAALRFPSPRRRCSPTRRWRRRGRRGSRRTWAPRRTTRIGTIRLARNVFRRVPIDERGTLCVVERELLDVDRAQERVQCELAGSETTRAFLERAPRVARAEWLPEAVVTRRNGLAGGRSDQAPHDRRRESGEIARQ